MTFAQFAGWWVMCAVAWGLIKWGGHNLIRFVMHSEEG